MLNYLLRSVLLFLVFTYTTSSAQLAYSHHSAKPEFYPTKTDAANALPLFERKLYQRNTGMIIGLQKGNSTSIELGYEAHWRKISLRKPHVIGATTNLEYNFGDNVVGYKAGMWVKRGRVNLTYGANVSYFTNFNQGHRFGIGPSVGFRLVGFHLVNGYNFLTKDKTADKETPIEVNKLYMSLRYYFPVTNNFTWDRKTMKKKKERRKEKEQRKKQREKKKQFAEETGTFKLLKPKQTSTKKKEAEEPTGVKKFLDKLKAKPKD